MGSILEESWCFLCQCPTCSLQGDQLRENEEARREVLRLKERIKLLSSVTTLGAVQEAFMLGKRKIKLLSKLEGEALTRYPMELLDCYQHASIIQFLGVTPRPLPEFFLEQAMERASTLGPTIQAICSSIKEE